MATQLTREQVPIEQTWNLDDIYATPEEWEADLGRVEADAAAVAAFQGRLDDGAGVLLACLRAYDAVLERLQRVGAYARLGASGDGVSPAFQARGARVAALGASVGAALAFLEIEVARLPEGTIERYLAEEPGLGLYRLRLDEVVRQRPYLLSLETEQALAALSETLDAPGLIWRRATAVDVACPPIEDEQGRATPVSIARYVFGLSQSPRRETRRRAYEALAAGLGRHKMTLATTLATFIKRNVTLARLRHYPSATAMILQPQEIPESVYENVLTIIHDESAPHVRRLMQLRRRVLGLDRLYRYDVEAPLDPDFDPPAAFAESAGPILAALRPLGEEYGAIMAAAFRDRWVDWGDNVGKSSGAFCSSVYGVHPYILTTWQNRMRDAFILAHELGHAGHGMLAGRNQVIGNARAGLFFIEAPSTANELLLGRHILDTTDDPRLRRWVILQFLGTFTHNMVTHMLEAHFERRLYELAEADQPLTLATIMQVQGEVFERYYAGTVTIDEAARLYWAQQPHFYTGLYPYTYSAGLACAYGVVEAIRREGQPAVDRWLSALKAGGSLPPLELAKLAGVDMSSPEPLRQAVAFFGQLVDELEQSFA
jgi:oligoendopeptidase F